MESSHRSAALVTVRVVQPATSADLWLEMIAAFAADGVRVISVVLLAEHQVPRPRELPVQITIEHVDRQPELVIVTGEIDDGRRIRLEIDPLGREQAIGELGL